jgi:trans-aconitate methyltransferase
MTAARTKTTTSDADGYVLGRTASEYDRLRVQARAWEPATARLLDQIGLTPGARCLDAGCGPGETMRLLAQRVGPGGAVVGIDVDERLGAQALDALHAAGHAQCAFAALDVTSGTAIPGAPFDLVFARLLLMHLPDPTAVLARLWDAVAPDGHLVIQDFDLRGVSATPALDSVAEFRRGVLGTFTAAGRHVDLGARLPSLFADAGIGAPDGTDVAGRLEPLAAAGPGIAAVWESARPAAVAHGLIAVDAAARWRDAFTRDTAEHPGHMLLWPLLVGAWKRHMP